MTTTCYYYNPDGDMEILKLPKIESYPGVFFRKYTESPAEIEISKRLSLFPHSNCVQILNVNEDDHYVDMEYLRTNTGHPDTKSIQDALNHFHSIGIVYIDIKRDNIGYSESDRTYKFFDFDMSGVVDVFHPHEWFIPPVEGYLFKKAKEIIPNVNLLYDYDTTIFQCLYKRI